MHKEQQLFIGVDGGGTKCQARLENAQGEFLGEGLAGSANPARDSQLAIQSILTSSLLALQQNGLGAADFSRTSIVLGLAGVNVPKYRLLIEQWQHPYANLHLTTDLHIACLGSHAGQDGAIVISGTGSSAFSVVNSQHVILGGHGFPLGDKGSGAWLGWQSLVATLECLDEMRMSSPLTEYIAAHFKATNATDIVGQALKYAPVDYAKFAPLVLSYYERGDHNAVLIVDEALDYLESLIQRLSRTKPPRISMIGSIAKRLSRYLKPETQAMLSAPLNSPEVGAAALARTLFAEKK